MMKQLALGAAYLAASVAMARAAPEMLPADVIPEHYDLTLSPDVQAMNWHGAVTIAIEVKRATADVVLNAQNLAFDRVTLDGTMNGSAHFDAKLGRATLHFARAIAPGRHTLAIDYRGTIGRETLGFFAMDYATLHGPRRTLATNFEPGFARAFLPCWDEPARKATFRLSVDVPIDRAVVSNMPIEHAEIITPTTKRVHFMTTPKMSTYLLFLAIGDFRGSRRTADGVDVGVLVRRGDSAKGAYALGEASDLLHYYDDYFAYHYPLPKLDLVAAPGEIDGGSMENWGAIFYSQDELLFDPASSTEDDRRDVFETVSHEMSHQWFGDLVTMAWWDNLWLNEGFAEWMQAHAADALHPEWKAGLQAQATFEHGKEADAAPDTHPIVQPVETAAQALLAFDPITYGKAAAVITMLNAYIGPDTFRDGVRRYMRAHAFGNTVDSDLWTIMQSVANKPILAIARDFTRQEGLPLVRVSDTPQGIHLAEDRFVADPSQRVNTQHWLVPLAIAAPGAQPQSLLLKGTADVAMHAPMLVNAGQTAYARVLYPQADFEALLPEMPRLAAVDQLGLMNDAGALGLAGYAPLSNLFQLALALPTTADAVVWRRVAAMVTELDRHYSDGPPREAFRALSRRLLAPVLVQIGNSPRPGEDANTPLLRGELAQTLGRFGDRAVIARARARAANRAGTPEQQRTAVALAAMQATAPEFDSLLARARAVLDPLKKEHLYDALAGVENLALARRMIAIALTGEVPAGSNSDILATIADNHPDLVWREAVPHLAQPAAGLARDEQWHVAADAAARLSDGGRIVEVEAWEKKNVPPDARRPFAGAIAAIRRNVRIAAQVLPALDRWIARQQDRK